MQPHKPTPKHWPRISAAVFYEDAPAAIDFLTRAFGFEVRLRIDGAAGRIEHSELVYGDGLIFVASLGRPRAVPLPSASPRTLPGGANTQSLAVFVDDADAHCAHARTQGAVIADEPTTQDHGPEYWADRSYRAIDPEGHHWYFMQRVRDQVAK
jgi:uncharacterized glyoxalase superfamily protein PhnB